MKRRIIPHNSKPIYDNQCISFIDAIFKGICNKCFKPLLWRQRNEVSNDDDRECPSWYARCCNRTYFAEVDKVNTFIELNTEDDNNDF